MGALQVDAFASGVGGEKDLDLGVVLEQFLRFHTLLAPHAAVDHHHRRFAPKQRRDSAFQVVQGVAVLGEENELLRGRRDGFGNWRGFALVRCPVFRHSAGDGSRCEDFRKQGCQLPPLPVLAASPNGRCQRLQALERLYFGPQLGDAARGGGLVEDLLLGNLDLVVGCVFEVLHIVVIQLANRGSQGRRDFSAAVEKLQLT